MATIKCETSGRGKTSNGGHISKTRLPVRSLSTPAFLTGSATASQKIAGSNRSSKAIVAALLASVVWLVPSCGDGDEAGGFRCEDSSFGFSGCSTVRSCCSEHSCYYDVDGRTFDCAGTDCSAASDRVVAFCLSNAGDATGGDVPAVDNGGASESDSGSSGCNPCRYCARVGSYSSNSSGQFVAANEVYCRPAECDADGEVNCQVNEPMSFVGTASDCTEFEDTCPGDESIDCAGEADRCSVYRSSSSTWDCSEIQNCNHFSGNWECPYGYQKGDRCD